MKREEVKEIFPDATDEQLSKILGIYGSNVEKLKKEISETKSSGEAKSKEFNDLLKQIEDLKSKSSDSDKLKKEIDDLNAKLEKSQEKINSYEYSQRFAEAKDGKEFCHKAVEESYKQKFIEALGKDEYKDKSGKDILSALCEGDDKCFKQAVKLVGAATKDIPKEADIAKTRAVMGLPPLK